MPGPVPASVVAPSSGWRLPDAGRKMLSNRRVIHKYLIRTRPQKESPDTVTGRGRSLRLSAVWGTFATGLDIRRSGMSLQNGFLRSDGQHKKASSHTAKAPAHENQRLCLVPHTCRFLGQQSLGLSNGR
jgi:hypothetical protein